jgi:large subunit ribosomal protein L10
MNLEQKQAVVDELAVKLRSASALYLTDFSGLNVKRMTDLRARLRKAGLEYIVVKNTLAERALEGLEFADIATFFRGPTGVVIAREDPLSGARVLSEFAKTNDNRPAVKAGVVDQRAISAEVVERLANLPTRTELLAQLAGLLEAPMTRFMIVLQAKLYEFAGLLEALREERAAS